MRNLRNQLKVAFIFIICLTKIFTTEGQESENFNASNASNCSTEAIQILRTHFNLHQGVEGVNPEADYIGNYAARRGFFLGKNWYPLLDHKQILCGNLNRFSVYDGIGDEMDWNLFVLPDNEVYNRLVLGNKVYDLSNWLESIDITRYRDSEWHKTSGNYTLIEGEITPDENLYNFPWFPKDGIKSILVDRKICLYGPYVREEVHGNRPEIHPCEQIWWRDDQDSYYLLMLVDDSNRFDDPQNFGFDINVNGTILNPKPDNWEPWATEDALSGKFKIAFELNPSEDFQSYQINLVDHREINNTKTHRDSDDGIEHAIEYNGKVVLKITEPYSHDNKVGVTFEELCFNAQENKLQGYIAITSTISNGEGKEGMIMFRVDKEERKIGRRIAHIWEYGGLEPWQEFAEDTDKTPIQDIRASNYNGHGNIDDFIDFNGDGRVDLFKKKGNAWYVFYNGDTKWTRINTSSVPINKLKFGDFNGDRKTDIITAFGDNWHISYGGTASWKKVNRSKYSFDNFRVGDFNGDGYSDIISNDIGSHRFKISSKATGSWKKLEIPYFPNRGYGKERFVKTPMNQLRFGDFNGDGKTDVFTINYGTSGWEKDTWWVSWGADTNWKLLRKDNEKKELDKLVFGNFDTGSRTTDVLHISPYGQWNYSYGAKTDWNLAYGIRLDLLASIFGDFDWDGVVEGMKVNKKSVIAIPSVVFQNGELPATRMAVKGEYIKNSLRRYERGEHSTLTMDIKLDFYGAENNPFGINTTFLPKENITIDKIVNLNTGNNLQQSQFIQSKDSLNPSGSILRSIDIFPNKSTEFNIAMSNKRSADFTIPKFSVTTFPTEQKIIASSERLDTTFWEGLEKITFNEVGVNKISPLVSTFIKEYQLAVTPLYLPMRNGEIARGESSPITEELNEIIIGKDDSKLQKLFGNTEPFDLQWSFEAIDLISQQTVPVIQNEQSADNITVTISDTDYPNGKINLFFPEDKNLYFVIATANIEDVYGQEEVYSYPIFSHLIKIGKNEKQQLLNLDLPQKEQFVKLVNAFSEDETLTISEISTLMRTAFEATNHDSRYSRGKTALSFKKDLNIIWDQDEFIEPKGYEGFYYPIPFEVKKDLFPSNQKDLKVKAIALEFVHDNTLPHMAVRLNIGEKEGMNRMVYNGKINTWSGDLQERWKVMINQSPIGSWTISVPNNDRVWGWFREERIKDVVLKITYESEKKRGH